MKPTTTIILACLLILIQAAAVYGLTPIPDSGQTKCYDNEKEIPCLKAI